MEEILGKIKELLNKATATLTPYEARQIMSEVIEEAQRLDEDCIKMIYAFEDSQNDEE